VAPLFSSYTKTGDTTPRILFLPLSTPGSVGAHEAHPDDHLSRAAVAGCLKRRGDGCNGTIAELPTPISSLRYHEFSVMPRIARSQPRTRGRFTLRVLVSLAEVGAAELVSVALFRTCPCRICGMQVGVTHVAFPARIFVPLPRRQEAPGRSSPHHFDVSRVKKCVIVLCCIVCSY